MDKTARIIFRWTELNTNSLQYYSTYMVSISRSYSQMQKSPRCRGHRKVLHVRKLIYILQYDMNSGCN